MKGALELLALSLFAPGIALARPQCKTSPMDASWPSIDEWHALNASIDGTLIRTAPAASACYPGNPFNVSNSCDEVRKNWSYEEYQAALPEGIDSPMYANNSCLPPGVSGYNPSKGCAVGGSPSYIVEARTEHQVAVAFAWATKRNIRVVVKGTGHDYNGRSSGAYALSIWTHALRNIEYHLQWPLPDGNGTENAIVTGSGNTWSVLYSFANQLNRVVVGGGDHSVGLGGYLQGGGHGPLSSQFGLGADQILQATVVAADGQVLTANNVQNRDLFWAIKGGGAGQYGVVTEYVLKSHPAPSNVVTGSLSVYGARNASADEAWSAVTAVLSSIPDLMDSLPLAGTINIAAGATGKSMVGANYTVPGAVIAPSFYGYNMTKTQLHDVLQSLASKASAASNRTGSIIATPGAIQSYPSFLAFFNSTNSSPTASVSSSLMSSRLLGRAELTDLPMPDLKRHLQNFVEGENGSMLLFGLQGGRGPRTVASHLRGAVNPVWRSVYAHVLSFGAPINVTGVPSVELPKAGRWSETHREAYWRVWAPDTGAYMNEANTFNTHWKKDFYGVYYDELLKIKMKYDPSGSLFVRNGVGSDRWDYDLDTGLLCRVDCAVV